MLEGLATALQATDVVLLAGDITSFGRQEQAQAVARAIYRHDPSGWAIRWCSTPALHTEATMPGWRSKAPNYARPSCGRQPTLFAVGEGPSLAGKPGDFACLPMLPQNGQTREPPSASRTS